MCRQPHTSLTLAPSDQPGDSRTYGFQLQWADDYDDIRQHLVDDGLVDVQVVPGMTVPSDLFAEIALRSKEPIVGVDAEFPAQTNIESLGRRGEYQLYRIRFGRLGENRLNVRIDSARGTRLSRVLRDGAGRDDDQETRRVHRPLPAPRSSEVVQRPDHRLEHGGSSAAESRQL